MHIGGPRRTIASQRTPAVMVHNEGRENITLAVQILSQPGLQPTTGFGSTG